MANGLINLQTDLKSLRYGSDKPFITKDINNPPTSNQTGMQLQKRLDDTSRIAQMLVSKPGLKYLANEALLKQVGAGDKIAKAQKEGKSVVGAILQQVGGTFVNTVKIVGSTLAQVPVNGTGTHFLKGFRTDTYLQPSGGNIGSAFAQFFGAGGVHGAEYAIKGEPVPGEHLTELVGKYSQYDYDDYLNTTRSEKDLKTQNKLNAQSGIPITVIPSGSGVRETSLANYDDSGISMNMVDLGTYMDNTDPSHIKPLQDTRVDNFSSNAAYLTGLEDISLRGGKSIVKESRVGLGSQGLGRASYSNYMQQDGKQELRVDKVNRLDILSLDNHENEVNLADGRDLAKFYFEIITPEDNKFLHFRAFIDSIDDGYTANWQGHKYNGRAENFYTYGGFDRDISISFNIAAATRAEMKPLYRKMVFLASATAPTYGASGLMRGTLAKMTIGSYFSQIPGVITSVKYTVDNNVPWEIALSNPDGGAGNQTDDDVQELPMVLRCSVSFKPIHDFAPQTGLYHYFTSNKGANGSKSFFVEREGTNIPAKSSTQRVSDPPYQQPQAKVPKTVGVEQTALDKAVAANRAAKTTATRKTTSAIVQGATSALKNQQKGETWKNTGGVSPQQAALLKAKGR